jgi:hypothetical protein
MEANGKLFGQYTKPAIGLPLIGCTFEIAMHARAGRFPIAAHRVTAKAGAIRYYFKSTE